MFANLQKRSVNELLAVIKILGLVIFGLIAICAMSLLIALRPPPIIVKVPGPNGAIVEAEKVSPAYALSIATISTSLITGINSRNVESNINTLDVFLAPELKNSVFQNMRARAKELAMEKADGNYFFVLKRRSYDAALDRYFVIGDVCFNNAINTTIGTCKPWVLEYQFRTEYYSNLIASFVQYEGDVPHDTSYLDAEKKRAAS